MAVAKGTKRKAKAVQTPTRRRAKQLPTKKPKRARKASEQDLIVCGAHGETPATFVCRHVADGVACGFHAKRPTRTNPWPDAWCDLCEEAFQRGGGEWNDQNEHAADIRLLCTHCYEAARARNIEVPRLARGSAAQLTADETAELIHRAVHAAQALQDKSDKKWRWQDMGRWDFDGESAR